MSKIFMQMFNVYYWIIKWIDGQEGGRTDNVKTIYPIKLRFAGDITISVDLQMSFC